MGIVLNSSNNLQTSDKKQKDTIYQLLSSTIEMDELSLPNSVGTSKGMKIQDFSSMAVPVVRINDYVLKPNEIVSVDIDCTDFIPKITLKAQFAINTFYSQNFVKDGDILSIAIRSKTDTLKIIRNDYIITSADCSDMYTYGNNTEMYDSPYDVTFFGELFIPLLESTKNDYSYNGTSYETLYNLAKQMGLGFATNETNTNDKQIWLCNNITPYYFINQIAEHAWKDENSFFRVWIDVYYNLNFVNVNKQLMSPEDDVDFGAFLSNADNEYATGKDTSQQSTTVIPKVFSNLPQFKNTSFYINSWSPKNNSSQITYAIGSTTNCNLYEHNLNLSGKRYWKLKTEPIYDKSKLDSHIILRGRSKHNNNNETGLGIANYNFVDMYEKNPWMGIQYTCTNVDENPNNWDGNQHMNFMRAKVHNTVNNLELCKLNIEIQVKGTNQNIILGDKIPVTLIYKNSIAAKNANKEDIETYNIDLFYSGWYYVSGYNIIWDNIVDGGLESNFFQTFILTRREWPIPVPSDTINKNE